MATSVTAAIATDGSVVNDQYIKNDSGCCIFAPLPESPITEVDVPCVSDCASVPTNPCGLTHPDGSGTLAGCKSTTLPHFGVVMNKKTGICKQFGYYTSGNTEEYENECGALDKLKSVVTVLPCASETTYSVDSCDCFDTAAAGGNAQVVINTTDITTLKADVATAVAAAVTNKGVDDQQSTDIAKNAADILANHP